MKTPIALLLLLFSTLAAASGKTDCLLQRYDEYSRNRVTLFEKMHQVYARQHPKVYKVYAPVLTGHALFAQIDQFVFHYLAANEIGKLRLRHGFINAVPNWIKDACNGRNCVNALYLKLAKQPEFNALYAEWERYRALTKEAYKQPEIARAGKFYFELLGHARILPHARKDMRYYSIKVDRLRCD